MQPRSHLAPCAFSPPRWPNAWWSYYADFYPVTGSQSIYMGDTFIGIQSVGDLPPSTSAFSGYVLLSPVDLAPKANPPVGRQEQGGQGAVYYKRGTEWG